jgi:hypothetical protein
MMSRKMTHIGRAFANQYHHVLEAGMLPIRFAAGHSSTLIQY